MELQALGTVAFVLSLTWQFSAFLCYFLRRADPSRDLGPLSTIRSELHPFRWAIVIACYLLPAIEQGAPPTIGDGIALAFGLLNCWLYRDDDDDRWKRRRRQAASKIAEIGGRLQVVPAGGSA